MKKIDYSLYEGHSAELYFFFGVHYADYGPVVKIENDEIFVSGECFDTEKDVMEKDYYLNEGSFSWDIILRITDSGLIVKELGCFHQDFRDQNIKRALIGLGRVLISKGYNIDLSFINDQLK